MKKLTWLIGRKKIPLLTRLTTQKIVVFIIGIGCIVWGSTVLIDLPFDDAPSSDKATVPIKQRKMSGRELSRVRQEISHIKDASSEKNGKWFGLCKKQSIKSIEDFRRTVETDPTLSVYYAGFNWEEAKLGSLKDDVMAYVAHRKGDVIAQTAKPIKLPKGDGFITDGVRTARTFCCNDIEMTPSAGNPTPGPSVFPPVSGFPPAYPIGALPQLPTPHTLPVTLPSFPLHSYYPENLVYDRPPDSPPEDPPSPPVPEPATFLLMGVGLLALAALGRKK